MFVIGVDIVEVTRIQKAVDRWGDRFLERVFTPGELAYCGRRAGSLAARWAAKEAIAKALGTGWAPQEPHEAGWLAPTEIEVARQPSGEPVVHLHGRALARSQALGVIRWQLSLSHTREHAVAMALGWSTSQLT